MESKITLTDRSGIAFEADVDMIKSFFQIADGCKVTFYAPPVGEESNVIFVKENVKEIFKKIKEVKEDA